MELRTIYAHECSTCSGEAFGANDRCASCIRADAEDEEYKERHPCAAIGCTNTVPFADEPRCYTHTRW